MHSSHKYFISYMNRCGRLQSLFNFYAYNFPVISCYIINMICYFLQNISFIRITLLHLYGTEVYNFLYSLLCYIHVLAFAFCCVFTSLIHSFLQVEVVVAQLRENRFWKEVISRNKIIRNESHEVVPFSRCYPVSNCC